MGALRPYASVCRPCADAGPAGPSRRRPLSRQGRWVRATIREAPGSVHRLSTACGQSSPRYVGGPSTEGTSGAADPAPLRGGTGEAALGSLEAGGPAQAGSSSTLAQAGEPRKRAPVQTGAKRGRAGSAQAEPVRWDRRGVRPACRTCWMGSRRRRSLQPEPSRSHDRRCSSGSGWGEAPVARALRGPVREASSASAGVIRRPPWMAPDP